MGMDSSFNLPVHKRKVRFSSRLNAFGFKGLQRGIFENVFKNENKEEEETGVMGRINSLR